MRSERGEGRFREPVYQKTRAMKELFRVCRQEFAGEELVNKDISSMFTG